MGRIIIAGRSWPLPDDIPVTTFLEPGGLSFYEQTGPTFTARTFVNDMNETAPYVTPRRLPPPAQGRAGLGGAGWAEAGEGDPIQALRKVVRTVVLHHDGSASSRDCFRTLMVRGLSTHFMVDADGRVFQTTDVADEASHASGVNAVSVGIDLNNPAPNLLNAQPSEGGGGRTVSKEMVINGTVFRSFNYTEPQYRSLIEVLRVLCEALGIEPVFPVGEDGGILNSVLQAPPPAEFQGIQCHWHSSADKWDPGPGLDWERILAGLRAEEATVPVVPVGMAEALAPVDRKRYPHETWASDEAARRAVTSALGAEETGERLLTAFCRASEAHSGGGYYPAGIHQTWHGGIHMPVLRGTMVRPMIPGDLVAAHMVPRTDWPDLGSNNFVLLRHRIPLPPRFSVPEPTSPSQGEKPGAENILTVFSLYMHLDGVNWHNPPDTALFQKLTAHSSESAGDPGHPKGPMLESNPKANQVVALKQGWLGLFSPADGKAGSIRLTPRDELWRVGEFGRGEDRRPVLHVEVFADARYAEAMELSLYGKYLQMGPDEPESTDLVVRNRPLLALLGEPERFEPPFRTEKTLKSEQIRSFFEERNDPDILKTRAYLRRLITRHVSEWSDRVRWVETLFKAQEGQDWYRRLSGRTDRNEERERTSWVFTDEIRSYLRYVWLTEDVARHIGAQWDHGVFTYFHPIHFLLWWLYRRSAVRGKTLDQILREVGGQDLSLRRGVPLSPDDVVNLPGEGEWKI